MFIFIKQTGRQVVVVIDEYDAPLPDVIHDSEVHDKVRNLMQEFYRGCLTPFMYSNLKRQALPNKRWIR